MQLSRTTWSLELVAIDMFGPLAKTKAGIQLLRRVRGRTLELTKASPTMKKTAAIVRTVFINDYMANPAIASRVMINNSLQLTSRFFQLICEGLVVDPLISTEYHPDATIGVGRFNTMNVSRFLHQVTEKQKD